MKIVTVHQMQQAERECSQFGISTDMLMEHAGKAVAEKTCQIVGNLQKQNILVLVGPGNNGGDGLVAARYFCDLGVGRVKVYLCGKRSDNDIHLNEIERRSIHFREIANDDNLSKFTEWLSEASVVLDSVFGTGIIRPFSGILSQALTCVTDVKRHRPDLQIIALDLPSGLNADTGSVDPATPKVDYTLTLGFPKIGLYNLPGAERAGAISIIDIGIPPQVVDHVNAELLTSAMIKKVLPERSPVSHKGIYGKVLAFTGSNNYVGAAYLACNGTIRVGAGLTTLAIAHSLQPILAAKLTEVTYLPLPESAPGVASLDSLAVFRQYLDQYNVFLIGCGIGQSQSAMELVQILLTDPQLKLPSLILDADGLNALTRIPHWETLFHDEAIFTPHAGEMSRLLNLSIDEIQSNRIEITRDAAIKWHKTVVLKGAYSVIASADGRVRVSPFANAGLASAGTGDVLAGAIAGMVAQGLSLFDAASCGVYLHGLAAEKVSLELGDAGMLASDLLPELPRAIRQLKQV